MVSKKQVSAIKKEDLKQEKTTDFNKDKNDEITISILNEKIDLLKGEVSENKLYLELCFVALLVVIFGYFKTDAGLSAFREGSIIAKLMIVIAIGLYVGIIYFFYSILKFNQKNRKLIEEKIQKLV